MVDVSLNNPEYWIDRLCKLRVYNAKHGSAPHKRLLLLVLFDVLEEGMVQDERIGLTPELAFRFSVYASVVAHRRTQPILVRFPFFHLHSDGFWHPLDDKGAPASDSKHVSAAAIDPGFLAFALDPDSRTRARHLLIAKYFPAEERAALYALVGLDVPPDDEIQRNADYEPIQDAAVKGREAKFRIAVTYNYRFTCALTRYCLTTVDAGSIVDAAHIHQFSDSRNNDPRNGLALSKNAHWMFDNGLWTIGDDYRVIVARGVFADHAGDEGFKRLQDYEGVRVHLPDAEEFWPDRRHLAWHRERRFKRDTAMPDTGS